VSHIQIKKKWDRVLPFSCSLLNKKAFSAQPIPLELRIC